jgi:ABC-type lipoprotein release transport system permease subunit
MIPIIAWRNIWRSRTRSGVVIGAIALGVWAALFMSGFATGMMNSFINNSIEQVISHIQIHHPKYEEEQDVKYRIEHPGQIADQIRVDPQVQAVSVRSVANGMIATSASTRGIQITGVDPESEIQIRQFDSKITQGEYFGDSRSNQILIGERLAEKLKIELRKKVVLTFQDLDGNITSAAFRIVGLFRTNNKPFDESQVFVMRSDLNRLLSNEEEDVNGSIAHEIAVLLKDAGAVEVLDAEWGAAFPDLLVQTYREISPDLELYESQMQFISLIYLTIIMFALLFGIINTMLMAVLERFRELGMLMAIGMNKVKVFTMIVLETVLLCLVSAPIGLLLGWGTIRYLGSRGLNLSAYSESIAQYGMSEMVYFQVDPIVYWQVPVAVAITALIAAIYPAWKAIRLRPVEAIRKL